MKKNLTKVERKFFPKSYIKSYDLAKQYGWNHKNAERYAQEKLENSLNKRKKRISRPFSFSPIKFRGF